MGGHLFRRKALAFFLLAGGLIYVLSAAAEGALKEGGLVRQESGEAVEATLTAASGRGAEALYSLEIPAEPSIPRKIEVFSSTYRAPTQAALQRAAFYRQVVSRIIRELDLPRELLFLPVLESGYQARAVSRSGAMGLWQLMRNTAEPLGLKIDGWRDERRDFWKGTEAALRKLKEHHAYFGDWPLALAAYNCGWGTLTRAMARTGIRDFWALRRGRHLPRETLEFVPNFYALAAIGSYPVRYGFDLGWEQAPAWERIELRSHVDLELLSQASGMPLELLLAGNAELKMAVTPGDPQGYWLKVPAEWREAVVRVLEDPNFAAMRFSYHAVRSGDTFYGLARRYGVSLDLLIKVNPRLDPLRLQLGSLVRVPLLGRGSS